VDGTAIGNVNLGAGAGNPLVLDFDTGGRLTTAMPVNADVTITSGATSPISFSLDLNGTSQFGSPFSVNNLYQDGYSSGRLAGLNIGSDGTIKGRYTNGQSQDLAQIVLASFANPNGLKPLGQNQWADSPDSGLPVIGVPGGGNLGGVQSSAVEDSNVDLTAELVAMITAQRMYQANAQSIKTQDEVMQTLVNLR
jgi:flagellar hook protein FlgE